MKSLSGDARARDEQLKRALSPISLPTAVAMPVNASVQVSAVIPSSVKTFTSSTYPSLVAFRCAGNSEEYAAIFKTGDDLRQDQLAMQLLKIMDSIFRDEGLDLPFLVYDVIPVSASEGMVSFVKGALPLRVVERRHRSISNFLFPETLDTFVGSVAAWCAATYALGVGDRHLDNILLKKTGQIIHIDFGFIFGRDPKPFGAPPVRITRSMIDAMGRAGYDRFERLSQEAFLALRKHMDLLLNLVRLMVDAGIPDLSVHQRPSDVLDAMRQRFFPSKDEPAAARAFLDVLRVSSRAIMPRIYDFFHNFSVG